MGAPEAVKCLRLCFKWQSTFFIIAVTLEEFNNKRDQKILDT